MIEDSQKSGFRIRFKGRASLVGVRSEVNSVKRSQLGESQNKVLG